jgi:hypothetical protein
VPQLLTLVDATGTARRLQSLACAGYGLGDVAEALESRRLTVQGWRRKRHPLVRSDSRDLVATLYARWWDTDGPSQAARSYAAKHGWLPFEAWTDDILDDPQAAPYSDPEALAYLDWVLLEQVRSRRREFRALSDAERLYLFRLHMGQGGTSRGFRDRYRPVSAEVLRWLQEHA